MCFESWVQALISIYLDLQISFIHLPIYSWSPSYLDLQISLIYLPISSCGHSLQSSGIFRQFGYRDKARLFNKVGYPRCALHIWRHSRLYNQWRHMRFLSIYLRRRHFPNIGRIESNQPYYTTLKLRV